MPLSFAATAYQTRDTYMIESTVAIYRQTAGNPNIPVANIYDLADPGDHRKLKMYFEGGALFFSAAYDGPLRDKFIWNFRDEQGKDTGICLLVYPWAQQSCLSSMDGFFPIQTECTDDSFTITVCRSTPVPQKDGLLYTPLATLVQTGRSEKRFDYQIQVEESVPTPLLMAIFTLPFTLLNIS